VASRNGPFLTLVALVLMPTASEPAPGSLNSWHQITCSFSAAGTQRAICSGVPNWIRVRITQPVTPYDGRFAGGCELLLDDELLHGAGVAAPQPGPLRHQQPGFDQRPLSRVAVQVAQALHLRPDGGADLFGLVRQADRRGTADPPRTWSVTSMAATSASIRAWMAASRRRPSVIAPKTPLDPQARSLRRN
jgi:hypothetical protein